MATRLALPSPLGRVGHLSTQPRHLHFSPRGSTRHIDNGRHRAVLRFEAMDADRWLFLLVAQDRRRFTDADLQEWRESLHPASGEAGLVVESTSQGGGV